MKLVTFGLMMLFLMGSVVTQQRDTDYEIVDVDIIEKNDWKCVEIGPKPLDETEKKKGVQQEDEQKVEHYISESEMEQLINIKNDKNRRYNSDDINCVIDRIRGDKYERYPMVCTRNNEKIEFFDHPYVMNNRFSKTNNLRSVTGSLEMTCEIYTPLNHPQSNDYTWKWLKKHNHTSWKSVHEILGNNNVEYTLTTSNSTNSTTLKLKDLTLDQGGEYKCMAYNQYGDHEHVFQVEVTSILSILAPYISMFVMMSLLSAGVFFRESIEEKKEIEALLSMRNNPSKF